MLVNFTKMHGLGNDFVIIDLMTQPLKLRTPQIKRIMDRHLGIGGDQLLLIEPPMRPTADFYYRIFNANGQEVEHCGNGARCAARFFYDMGFTNNRELELDCLAGTLKCSIEGNGAVKINMGKPKFKPAEIPFISEEEALLYPMQIENSHFSMSVISMGNPHAIIEVPNIETALVKKIGPWLSKHPFFPNGTNVGFMQVLDQNCIRLRVYERGVGETLACGTGACAAIVAGIKRKLLKNPVSVVFQRGTLQIIWQDEDSPVYMSGPTNSIFIGRFRL